MTLDVRTERQRWQDARAERIIAMYKQHKEHLGSTHALLKYIATEISKDPKDAITSEGVKYVLKKHKLL